MPLPIKSLHTIWDAMRFIRRATGETAMPDQILDWGTQGRYKLHLLIERGYIRAIGTKRIIRVRDSIFELHLSSEQAAILGRHDEVEISECWHNGIAFNFVRSHIGDPFSWYTYRASINGFGIRLLGTELAAFTASIAEPQQTALAMPASVAAASTSDDVGGYGARSEKPLQRSAAQDAAILREIKKQGYDPLALPKNSPGKSGVKAAVRTALAKNPLFTSKTVFDKAWERLTTSADIEIQR